jgi:hypothetical protein
VGWGNYEHSQQGLIDFPMTSSPSALRQHRRLWIDLVVVAVVAAIAGFLRYYKAGEVPPGFNSDEAVGAVGALETLRSGMRLYYAGQGGGGALGFYIVAIAFALFGPGIATIRGTTAFAGVASVVATYFLVREMFRTEGDVGGDVGSSTDGSLGRARLLAALAALGLATSMWHVQSSRVAFAAIGVPFLQVPAAFFLWRGLNTGRHIHFVLSGIFLASTTFVYMSGAFAPVVFLTFFLLQWAIAHLAASPSGQPSDSSARPLLVRHFRNLLICAGVTAVALVPMLIFYVSAPDLATQRAQQTLFTNPAINHGDPWGTLWRSIVGNLAAFGLSPSWFQGQAPPSLIMLLPMTLLFVLGLGVSLWRIRRSPYLFVVVSWAVMIVPSILSPDNIPHQARALGASPAAYTLIAVGMLAIADFVCLLAAVAIRAVGRQVGAPARRAVRHGMTALVLTGLWLWVLPVLLEGYRYYFTEWPHTNDAQAAYHVYAVDLAREMSREDNTRAVFLLPRDTAAGDINPNYTVMFLYTGQAGYAWIVDDEGTIEDAIGQAVAERDIVHVVRWKTSKHTGADPKEIIRYYLEKHGRHLDTRPFEYFDIETYELDRPGPDIRDVPLASTALEFDSTLSLTGYAFGDASGTNSHDESLQGTPQGDPAVPAGSTMWARLHVRLLRAIPEDLKLSVSVGDDAGHVVGQIDKLLLSNILHQGASQWTPGTETDAYFLVPVMPATAPGRYHVQVAVYSASSQRRLPVDGSDSVARPATLGTLAVRPDLVPPAEENLAMTRVLQEPVASGLTLLGYAAAQDSLRPGERVSLALLWRAEALMADDYRAAVWVANGDDVWPITSILPLAGLDYSTGRWGAGEVVRGWFDGRIPPNLPDGQHQFGVRVTDSSGRPVADVDLGVLSVAGWARQFEVPAIQNSLHANFADMMELLGYDLQLPTGDSAEPEIVLYWRALSQMDVGYTTFVHLLDEAGQVVAQVDHVPGDGAFPTTGWLEGEIIVDRFVVPHSLERIAAVRQLELGVYDPDTMRRLSVLGADGKAMDTRVLLPLVSTAAQAGEP